jgi:predicted nucleic acid-binding protein
MSVEAFLDTNVLVYAVSSAPAESAKKERALELIHDVDFGLSAQVLQEFYVNVTRKIARPLAPDAAVELLEQFRCFPMVATDYPLVVAGVEMALRHRISYWDGAIVAAAEALGAKTLYTEDLSHGQRYGSVEVVNPFLALSDSVHERAEGPYGKS